MAITGGWCGIRLLLETTRADAAENTNRKLGIAIILLGLGVASLIGVVAILSRGGSGRGP